MSDFKTALPIFSTAEVALNAGMRNGPEFRARLAAAGIEATVPGPRARWTETDLWLAVAAVKAAS